MATPVAAGGATLALQYFHDGFYPTGAASPADRIEVTSDLMRAVIANSAGPLADKNRQPSSARGFGVMHLGSSLVFADEPRLAHFGFRISNSLSFNRGGVEAVAEITTTSKDDPICVTLAWIDPPTAEGAHEPLFADIDLYVEAPSGLYIFGNALGSVEESRASTERIYIAKPVVGTYRIYVHVPELKDNVQIRTSVVVSGPFAHLDFETNPRFLAFRTRRYNRSCPSTRTGTLCQTDVLPVRGSVSLSSRVPAYRYFQIPSSATRQSVVTVTVTGLDSSGLFQFAIDVDQVAKFGGVPLFFGNLSQWAWTRTIDLALHPDIVPGSILYFTLYEAVSKRTVTLSVSVSGLTTHRQETQNAPPSLAQTGASPNGKHGTGTADPVETSQFDWKLIPIVIGSVVAYFAVFVVVRWGIGWARARLVAAPVEDVPERGERLLDETAQQIA
jgi:hypothetical protein